MCLFLLLGHASFFEVGLLNLSRLFTPLCPFGTVVAEIDSLDRFRSLSRTHSSTHLKGGDQSNNWRFVLLTVHSHCAEVDRFPLISPLEGEMSR